MTHYPGQFPEGQQASESPYSPDGQHPPQGDQQQNQSPYGSQPPASQPAEPQPPYFDPNQPSQSPAPQYGQAQPAPGQVGAPQSGTHQYGAPQYGAPQYGTPQYGAPQPGVPGSVAPYYATPNYGSNQYASNAYPNPNVANGTNQPGLWSLILGGSSFIVWMLPIIGFLALLMPIAGIVLGFIGLNRQKYEGRRALAGWGLGVSGAALVIVGLLVLLFFFAFFPLFFVSGPLYD